MAAYLRVYDSRHLQADCQKLGSAPEPYARYNRVWATFTFCIGSRNRALDGGARWYHLLGAMDKYLRCGGDAAVVTITAALVFVFIPLQQFRFLYRCSVDDCRVLQGFYTPCVVIRKLNI